MKQESENTDVIEKVVNGLFEKISKTENPLASLIIKLKKGRQKTEGKKETERWRERGPQIRASDVKREF